MARLFPGFLHLPAGAGDPEAWLRGLARGAILWLLWLLPAASGFLAARGGAGWEAVTALGFALAGAASLAGHRRLPGRTGRRARLVLGAAMAAATLLLLGAGHAVLPEGVRMALPLAALVLVAGLCDPRALALGLAVLALAALAQPGSALLLVGLLGLEAAGLRVGQRMVRRAARPHVAVLPPPRPARAPVWAGSAAASGHDVLVQAERTADGALRLAVASRAARGVRVTVC